MIDFRLILVMQRRREMMNWMINYLEVSSSNSKMEKMVMMTIRMIKNSLMKS